MSEESIPLDKLRKWFPEGLSRLNGLTKSMSKRFIIYYEPFYAPEISMSETEFHSAERTDYTRRLIGKAEEVKRLRATTPMTQINIRITEDTLRRFKAIVKRMFPDYAFTVSFEALLREFVERYEANYREIYGTLPYEGLAVETNERGEEAETALPPMPYEIQEFRDDLASTIRSIEGASKWNDKMAAAYSTQGDRKWYYKVLESPEYDEKRQILAKYEPELLIKAENLRELVKELDKIDEERKIQESRAREEKKVQEPGEGSSGATVMLRDRSGELRSFRLE